MKRVAAGDSLNNNARSAKGAPSFGQAHSRGRTLQQRSGKGKRLSVATHA
jgi:hypothetical protein